VEAAGEIYCGRDLLVTVSPSSRRTTRECLSSASMIRAHRGIRPSSCVPSCSQSCESDGSEESKGRYHRVFPPPRSKPGPLWSHVRPGWPMSPPLPGTLPTGDGGRQGALTAWGRVSVHRRADPARDRLSVVFALCGLICPPRTSAATAAERASGRSQADLEPTSSWSGSCKVWESPALLTLRSWARCSSWGTGSTE
jgi:hypothetical protein